MKNTDKRLITRRVEDSLIRALAEDRVYQVADAFVEMYALAKLGTDEPVQEGIDDVAIGVLEGIISV